MSKEKEELKLEVKKQERKKNTNVQKTTKTNKKNEEKVSVSRVAPKDKKTSTKMTSKTSTSISKSKQNLKLDDSKTKIVDTKKVNKNSKDKTNTDKKSSKKTNSSKNINQTNTKVTPIMKEEKVKEETIIEKIKNFIAKIVAMQEEAKNEELAKKEKKKNAKKSEITDISALLEKPEYLTEYYDLPYRYNETVVKILAQTPKRIFVYWDVADSDRIRYENAFGKDFFNKTYPVLLVHNDDKNYTTEIPINDFANSWYIDIKDPKTKYTIQLGRKFREVPKDLDINKIQEQNILLQTDYLPIAQSNLLEVPNDKILFNKMPSKIIYRNVKTYEEKEKVVANMKAPFGILYNIKEFYKNNYKNEIDNEILEFNNPTSGGLSSSSFK